jgi:hypothetical protein
MGVVMMNSAPMVVPKRPSWDMEIQIIRVFEGTVGRTVNMVVFWVEAIETDRHHVLRHFLNFTDARLGRGNMIVADCVIWAHSKHLEDILGVDFSLLREWLVCEHPLQVSLEFIAFKMASNILFAMACMTLIGMEKVLVIAGIDGTWEGRIKRLALIIDEIRGHGRNS